MNSSSRFTCALVACGALSFIAASTHAVITTFDNGTEGWSVSGRTNISPTGGNPGACLDVSLEDVFGAETRNNTNTDFLGDYSRFGLPVKLAADMKIDSITFFGSEVRRNLVLEMVDYNPPGSNYPYVSVWYDFGEIGSDLPGWRHVEQIIDPTQTTLPAGWGGTGDEDPVTFEPRLPPDRTFASVLASVDELRFTTFVPGFFYGFTNFVMQVDNVELTAVPEPGALSLFAAAGLLALCRRR